MTLASISHHLGDAHHSPSLDESLFLTVPGALINLPRFIMFFHSAQWLRPCIYFSLPNPTWLFIVWPFHPLSHSSSHWLVLSSTPRLCPSLSCFHIHSSVHSFHLLIDASFSRGLKATGLAYELAVRSYVKSWKPLQKNNCNINLKVTAALNSVWVAHTPVKREEWTLQVPFAENSDWQVGCKCSWPGVDGDREICNEHWWSV